MVFKGVQKRNEGRGGHAEMIKIAVVDDERPARSELKYQLMELLPEAEIDEGDSGAAALKLAGEGTYDLFFLDINLGDISGTDLVHAVQTMQPRARIVFVTAYSEYAVAAFELGVVDYVLKPYEKGRLKKVLDRCLAHDQGQTTAGKMKMPRKIPINSDGKTIFENVEDLVFLETYQRGCLIHTKKREYYEGKRIGEFEKRLGGGPFFRCHKSYLINLEKVREVFPWGNNSLGVKMEGYDKTVIPVGREKTKTLKSLLGWQ